MNEKLEKILYFPIYLVLWLHSLLPLSVLYLLSDILFLPLYYVVKYRRKVVYANMRASFPEKTDEEIYIMMKAFYHHFCDYFVETIKLLHISDKETKRRFEMENIEVIQKALDEQRQVILLLGHYGNWEYVPSMTLWLKHQPEAILGEVYRPLKNRWFDNFFLKLRSRYNTVNIPKNDVFKVFIRAKRDNTPAVVGFMADQTPSPNNIYYWTTFLNQDTPMLSGVERIAQKLDTTLIYADVIKLKRGYYKTIFTPITQNPKEFKEFEITELYARLMEKTILRAPEFWLWTHKRWKHKRKR